MSQALRRRVAVEILEKMTLQETLQAFQPNKGETGPEYHGACPACGGQDRGWVKEHEGRVRLHCRRGCDVDLMVEALFPDIYSSSLTERDSGGEMRWIKKTLPAKKYIYPDGSVKVAKRTDGKKEVHWQDRYSKDGPGLYRKTYGEEEVWIVEGEKDVETLEGLGLSATCGPNGSSSGIASLEEYIDNDLGAPQRVILCPDCDEPGRKHTRRWSEALTNRGLSWSVIDLDSHAGGQVGYDVTDALGNGVGGLDGLKSLMSEEGVLPWEVEDLSQWVMPTAGQVPEIPTSWLWKPYIPFNELTVIAGHGMAGKTTVACALAAAFSRGQEARIPDRIWDDCRSFVLPGEERYRPPLDVLFITLEDPGGILSAKLRVAEADMDRVRIWHPKPGEFSLDLGGLDALGMLVKMNKPDVIFLDHITAALPEGANQNDAKQARTHMDPLREIAEKTDYDLAMIALAHSAKITSHSQNVIGGSSQYGNASRSVLGAAKLVNKEGDESFYLSQNKTNRGRTASTVSYTITGHPDDPPNEGPALVKWLGQSDMTPGQIITAANTAEKTGEEATPATIREILLDHIPTRTEFEAGISLKDLMDNVKEEAGCEERAVYANLRRLKDEELIRSVVIGFGSDRTGTYWRSE